MGHVPLLVGPTGDAIRHASPGDVAKNGHAQAPQPNRSKRGMALGALLVVLAFAAGWMVASRGGMRRDKEDLPPQQGAGHADSAVAVTVEPVTYRPVQRVVEGVGTLHGFEEITISARVEGRVRKLCFDVADRVKPGEVLLEIDPTDYDLSVDQAERALQVELAKLGLNKAPGRDVDLEKVPTVMQARTRMDNANSRQDRVRQLSSSRAISAEELDNAISDFRAAQAEYANQLILARTGVAMITMKQSALAVAQQQLKDTQVRVPTPTIPVPDAPDGIVYAITHRQVAEGTLVRPGTEVCKLVINQTLKLRVPVPERHGAEIKLGQKAEVRTAAFPQPFTGAITRVNPAVEPLTRTFEVEIQVPNPKGELKPGGFAKVAILTRVEPEAATVPLTALVNFVGVNKIFLAEGDRAKEVRVTLGMQTTDWVEIVSPPLPRNAHAITSGQTVLAEQTPITIRAATGNQPKSTGEGASSR